MRMFWVVQQSYKVAREPASIDSLQDRGARLRWAESHFHHVVVHAGAAHGDELERLQGACAGDDRVRGGDGWYDVLHHALCQLICHPLHPVKPSFARSPSRNWWSRQA